jgi:molecular chaperone HscC
VSGDNHLGGSDIDALIVSEFISENPQLKGKLSMQQLGIIQKNAEACKIILSERQQVYMVYRHEEQEYSMMLDNLKLMEICSPLLVKFKDLIKRALQNAEFTMPQIDNIILIGGSCRMPLVREYIKQLTHKPVLSDIDPDHAVAIGVGVATGIKVRDEDIRDMVLTDICPFSLGVETRMGKKAGVFDAIIPRNTTLPASRIHAYTTVENYQELVKMKIYQGESLEAVKNLLLGECEISVPPLPVGEAQVMVRFTYDINGILDVEVNCLQSSSKNRKLIIRNNRLSEAEIDKRLAELSKLKAPPRDSGENNLIIARGQRLYEEFGGALQAEIVAKLIEFESALEGSNPARIALLRVKLSNFFDQLDRYSENLLFYGEAEDIDYEDPNG